MYLINNDHDLNIVEDALKDQKIIAIDTEFNRINTYLPKLSLIQIATENHKFIIDALSIKNLNLIKQILYDPAITKIIHDARQDYEIFYHHFGKKIPVNSFDTQIAASVLKFGHKLSYAKLCDKICNVTIDKTEQKSDWLKRPLTPLMMEYALSDVTYLHQIFEHLQSKLVAEKRMTEFNERIKKLIENPLCYEVNLEDAWRKVKFQNKSKEFIKKIQILAAFREETAKELDVPRRHFLKDFELVEICRKLPSDHDQLKKLRLRSRHLKLDKYKNKLFNLIEGMKEEAILLT